MQVGVVGINYKSSDLLAREGLTKVIHAHFTEKSELLSSLSIVLLSTCNRTELYFSADDLPQAHENLIHLLEKFASFPFKHLLYSHFREDCFLHLCRVCSGLDSVIFGESEIQRQVREAYQNAHEVRGLNSVTHYIFQKALHMGKYVRTAFSLPKKEGSIEGVIHQLITTFIKGKNQPSLLFIGNSEINRKMIASVKAKKYRDITLATRSPLAAVSFCQSNDITLFPWEELKSWVNFDVVISSTNQSGYLINEEDIHSFAEPARLIPTSLLIDLSMPRSIDPSLAVSPQIALFNIEEVNAILSKQSDMQEEEKDAIENALTLQVERSMQIFSLKQKERMPCELYTVLS